MISFNTETKLAPNAKWYILAKITLILLLISVPFSLAGRAVWSGFMWFGLFFLWLPVVVIALLRYHFISFVAEDHRLTINSGIITKRSKDIPFDRVQNVNTVRGLLVRTFGLSIVNIWTASPSQIRIDTRRNASEHKPDGVLVLTSSDAQWLKQHMTRKV